MARTLLAEVVPAYFGVEVPPLRLEPSADAPDDLAAYAGSYGWPDRHIEMTASDGRFVVTEDGVAKPAVPLDRSTFLMDPEDPDSPTIAFADFDDAGRPGVLYDLVWGLPRMPDD